MTTGRPGAVHVALPFDVQNGQWIAPTFGAIRSFGRYPARRVAPDPYFVERAAPLLGDAVRPVFICGGGVIIADAEAELLKLAERLSAPVATTISGKGSISRVASARRRRGRLQRRHAGDARYGGSGGSDFFIGCRAGSVTTERWRHPAPGKNKVFHLDVDPAVPGANYPVDAPLIGDAKLALAVLNDSLATDAAAAGRNRAWNTPRSRSSPDFRNSPWPTTSRSNPSVWSRS